MSEILYTNAGTSQDVSSKLAILSATTTVSFLLTQNTIVFLVLKILQCNFYLHYFQCSIRDIMTTVMGRIDYFRIVS